MNPLSIDEAFQKWWSDHYGDIDGPAVSNMKEMLRQAFFAGWISHIVPR